MSIKPTDNAFTQKIKKLEEEFVSCKQQLVAVQAQLARYKTILKASPDFFVLKDKNFVYQAVNSAFCAFLGRPEEDILGKTDFDFFPLAEAEMYRHDDKMIMETGRPQIQDEVTTVKAEKRFLQVAKTPVLDKSGAPEGILCSVRDITECKQAEAEKEKLHAQLLQAQKMEAIGTLAGGIAHDFNNKLAIILGYAVIARDNAPPGSQFEKYLETVLTAATQARDLVMQILAFSRQSKVKRIPIKLQPRIEEGVKMLRSMIPTTISISAEFDPNCGAILADPIQVDQILMNLCTNSYHAMEEKGGTLSVSMQTVHIDANDKMDPLQLKPGEYVELTVADTGRGIGPGILDKIFDPFFTTKETGKGTGMGLAIVHGIISDYGGTITVESQLGKGTIFHVYFPVTEKEILPGANESEQFPEGKERILFIDDEHFLAEMGKDILEGLGYSVTARQSSFEALETFQNGPGEFDLVITDQTMAHMPGSELARELLKIRPEVPVILCTGYSSIISEEKAKKIGIKRFLMKPVSRQDLAVTVREVLDKHKTRNT